MPQENKCHESNAPTQTEPQIQSRHELSKFRGLELGRIAGSFQRHGGSQPRVAGA